MPLDDLLAPRALFCIFCAKPRHGGPRISIPRLKRSTKNEMNFSCILVDQERKQNGIWEVSLRETEPEIRAFVERQKGSGITRLGTGISPGGSKGKR